VYRVKSEGQEEERLAGEHQTKRGCEELQRAHEEPRTGRAGGVTPGYCKDKEGEVLEGPDVSRDVALGGPHETAISAPGVGDQQPPRTSSS
jgi:hypothetical protein